MDILDIDDLVERFVYALPPDRQSEFRQVARDALIQLPCPGPGSAHRLLTQLVPRFFIPPIVDDIDGRSHRRPSKLINRTPLA